MIVHRPKGSKPKPDWSQWEWCPWCWAKAGEPCIVIADRSRKRGQASTSVHYARILYAGYLRGTNSSEYADGRPTSKEKI